jgi:hypothetical protein
VTKENGKGKKESHRRQTMKKAEGIVKRKRRGRRMERKER